MTYEVPGCCDCESSCPVPQHECEDKDFNLTNLQGHIPFDRYATDPDGTLGNDPLDPQFPASCQKYKVRTLSEGWTNPFSYSQTSLTGTPDQWVTFTQSETGTVMIVETIEHVGCHPYSETNVGSGSMDFESKDYGRYYDSDDEQYKTWLREHITINWTYVGGTTIPDPDAGELGEPATIDVPHGWNAFLKTETTVTKATHDATAVTDEEVELVSFSAVGNGGIPSTALDSVKTQSHTEKTDTLTVDYDNSSITDSGVYVSSEILSSPWTESAIAADLKTCINAKDWEAGACSADYTVTYNQKPKLDAQGDPVTEDHDEDPNTPEVPVYEDETGCVATMLLRKFRYRFVIPHNFEPPPAPHPQKWHGEYHKIEWEEVFTPHDHDPQNPTASPKVVTAKSVEWNGPGDELDTWSGWNGLTESQKQARRDSWKTAWNEVTYPASKGQTTIVLKRSKCYHSAPWVKHS